MALGWSDDPRQPRAPTADPAARAHEPHRRAHRRPTWRPPTASGCAALPATYGSRRTSSAAMARRIPTSTTGSVTVVTGFERGGAPGIRSARDEARELADGGPSAAGGEPRPVRATRTRRALDSAPTGCAQPGQRRTGGSRRRARPHLHVVENGTPHARWALAERSAGRTMERIESTPSPTTGTPCRAGPKLTAGPTGPDALRWGRRCAWNRLTFPR